MFLENLNLQFAYRQRPVEVSVIVSSASLHGRVHPRDWGIWFILCIKRINHQASEAIYALTMPLRWKWKRLGSEGSFEYFNGVDIPCISPSIIMKVMNWFPPALYEEVRNRKHPSMGILWPQVRKRFFSWAREFRGQHGGKFRLVESSWGPQSLCCRKVKNSSMHPTQNELGSFDKSFLYTKQEVKVFFYAFPSTHPFFLSELYDERNEEVKGGQGDKNVKKMEWDWGEGLGQVGIFPT